MNSIFKDLLCHWAFLSESEEKFTSENIFRKTTANRYMNNQLVNEQINSILLEGGNAIKDVVRINQENVAATLDNIYTKLLPKIGIKKEDTAVLGSTGKKLPGGTSGDIDLAIDTSKIENYNFKDWSKKVENILNSMSIEFRTFLGIYTLSLKWPIANTDGKQPNEFVQLDLMPTSDIDFATFSKFTPQEIEGIPHYKSTIRNAIFTSLAGCMPVKINAKGKLAIDPNGEDHVVDIEKYSYDFSKGLNLKHKIRKQRKDGLYNKTFVDVDKKFITSKPQEIIDRLFGQGHSVKDVETVLGTWNLALKSPLLKDEETKQLFFTLLKNDLEPKLDAQHIILPKEIASAIDITVSEAAKDISGLDTPRHALIKIHQLTGTKLKTFIRDLKNDLDSSSLIIKTTPKVDGNAIRIAWINDEVFIENSNSGLMGKDEIENQNLPPHIKNFYNHLLKQDNNIVFKEIKKYGLSGIKLIGELLANDESFVDDDGTITYIGTSYDASKLGKNGSVVIFDIKGANDDNLSDLDSTTEKTIIDFICSSKYSNSQISYFDVNNFAQEIELNKSDFSPELIREIDTINLTSKFSAEQTDRLKNQLNNDLTKVFKSKFKNPSIMKDDDKSIEGVAFELNGNLYGINYQSWKDIKQNNLKSVIEIQDFVKNFLAKIAGMSENSNINTIVKELRNNIDKYQPIYKSQYKDFLRQRHEIIDNLNNDTKIPKFVKSFGQYRADSLIKKFEDSEITDNLSSLLDIVAGKITDMNGKTICIIPGSFRPPHKGHFAMIEHYSKIADEVIVAISGQSTVSSRRPDKFGRTMPNYIAGQILQIYCKAYNLTNVKISLTMKLMQWLSWKLNTIKNAKIILGVSSKDDTSRFSAFITDRFKKEHPTLEILPIEDYQPKSTKLDSGDDVSATFVRQNIDNKEEIRKIVPDKLSDAEFNKVFELMNPPDGKYPPMVNKGVADSLFMPESKIIYESGEAFPDVSRINQENVEDTIKDFTEKFCEFTGITTNDIIPLGSTGKRLPGQSSGDIDLGISLTALSNNGIDIKDKNAWYDLCEEFAKKYDTNVRHYKNFGVSSIKWPNANTDGKQPNEFVQVDLNPHENLDMLDWGMHQVKEDPKEEYAKSAVRALLLQAIVAIGFSKPLNRVEINGKNELVKVEEYKYKQNSGLFKSIKERLPKKDGTYNKTFKELERTKITDKPQEIVDFIFGAGKYKANELLSVKSVWDAFKDSKFYKDINTRKNIKELFDKYMENFNIPRPSFVIFDESNIFEKKSSNINTNTDAEVSDNSKGSEKPKDTHELMTAYFCSVDDKKFNSLNPDKKNEAECDIILSKIYDDIKNGSKLIGYNDKEVESIQLYDKKYIALAQAYSAAIEIRKHYNYNIKHVILTGRSWHDDVSKFQGIANLKKFGINTYGMKDFNSSDIIITNKSINTNEDRKNNSVKYHFLGISLKKSSTENEEPTRTNISLINLLKYFDSNIENEISDILNKFFTDTIKNKIIDGKVIDDIDEKEFDDLINNSKSNIYDGYTGKTLKKKFNSKQNIEGENWKTYLSTKYGLLALSKPVKDKIRDIINNELSKNNNSIFNKLKPLLEKYSDKLADALFSIIFKTSLAILNTHGFDFAVCKGIGKFIKHQCEVKTADYESINTIIDEIEKIKHGTNDISISFDGKPEFNEYNNAAKLFFDLNIGDNTLANLELRYKGDYTASPQIFSFISKWFKDKLSQ